jgi:hypothetical protein
VAAPRNLLRCFKMVSSSLKAGAANQVWLNMQPRPAGRAGFFRNGKRPKQTSNVNLDMAEACSAKTAKHCSRDAGSCPTNTTRRSPLFSRGKRDSSNRQGKGQGSREKRRGDMARTDDSKRHGLHFFPLWTNPTPESPNPGTFLCR